ncbi:MAG: alpha/beta hydrolase-fold protein [Ginsengibacter sp.]
MTRILYFFTALSFLLLAGCHPKIKERNDNIYSRHLQKHIDLTVINTPVPKDKGSYNLLLLNDGQDAEKLRIKDIVDSLNRKKLIQPLVIVAINAFDRTQEYGVAGNPDYRGNGASAEKYANFIINELLPFIKKQSGVRKFNSVTFAGWSLGGLSALDVSWDHADKIDKVGAFSGAWRYSDKDIADSNYTNDKNRIITNKIRSSRKRPHLKYWFYAGAAGETSDKDKEGLKDENDNTRDLIDLIKKKKVCPPGDISYIEVKDGNNDYASWSNQLPQFLIWAVGK